VRGAEDPATDTRARVWRAVLEPVVAETPLCCATWAPTVAVGATGSAGGEIEAEAAATGVDTVAVDFEPTATVAVTEVWPGVGTVGDTDAVGVETVGVVAVGVDGDEVVTDGTDTLGAESVGVVTVGVETAGVGTETVGVTTVGVATIGVATLGVAAVGVGVGPPSASAAPDRPPHANNTNAATDEALRRRALLISHSEIPRSPTLKPIAWLRPPRQARTITRPC
jgi:hypothetical protein